MQLPTFGFSHQGRGGKGVGVGFLPHLGVVTQDGHLGVFWSLLIALIRINRTIVQTSKRIYYSSQREMCHPQIYGHIAAMRQMTIGVLT
jgi:hypothetical protein